MNDMSTTSERSSAATKVITRMRVPGGRELHLPLAPGEAVTQEVESWPLELTDQEKAAWVAKATVVALRRCTLVLIETAEGETAAGTICAHAKAKFDREIGVARARDRALRLGR